MTTVRVGSTRGSPVEAAPRGSGGRGDLQCLLERRAGRLGLARRQDHGDREHVRGPGLDGEGDGRQRRPRRPGQGRPTRPGLPSPPWTGSASVKRTEACGSSAEPSLPSTTVTPICDVGLRADDGGRRALRRRQRRRVEAHRAQDEVVARRQGRRGGHEVDLGRHGAGLPQLRVGHPDRLREPGVSGRGGERPLHRPVEASERASSAPAAAIWFVAWRRGQRRRPDSLRTEAAHGRRGVGGRDRLHAEEPVDRRPQLGHGLGPVGEDGRRARRPPIRTGTSRRRGPPGPPGRRSAARRCRARSAIVWRVWACRLPTRLRTSDAVALDWLATTAPCAASDRLELAS